jgi:hypothetical protein
MSASMMESPVEEPVDWTCKAVDLLVIAAIIETCTAQNADAVANLLKVSVKAII